MNEGKLKSIDKNISDAVKSLRNVHILGADAPTFTTTLMLLQQAVVTLKELEQQDGEQQDNNKNPSGKYAQQSKRTATHSSTGS